MSNSTEKMDVSIVDAPWGKRWVKVRLKRYREFYPSFEDLHRIIQAISYCEDEKYPNGEGRGMVLHFLLDAVMESDFSKLASKYKIPVREGNKLKE